KAKNPISDYETLSNLYQMGLLKSLISDLALNNMATKGHFDISKVLKLKTIRGWITTYAAVLKRRNAEKALTEGGISSQNCKKRRLQ
ncbi:12113_t:CDS:2, partial [Funneliformis geosporum]